MTTAETPAVPKPNWVRRIVFVLLGIAALIVTYFILASFVPRWWSQRAAALSDSSFARGTAWGLFFGIVCTLVPLLLILLAVLIFQRRRSRMWIAGIAVGGGAAGGAAEPDDALGGAGHEQRRPRG